MKPCIVNVGISHWYPKGTARLLESLRNVGYTGDHLVFTEHFPSGSPSHEEVPYHFKTFAMLQAMGMGYDVLLWVDSSIWAAQPIVPLLERIQQEQYMIWNCGFSVGQWCTDAALDIMAVKRDDAMNMKLIVGGIIGINCRSMVGYELLTRLHNFGRAGAFNGPWNNNDGSASSDPRCLGHRHDQPVLGVLAHQMGLKITDCPDGFAYDVGQSTNPQSTFLARGM